MTDKIDKTSDTFGRLLGAQDALHELTLAIDERPIVNMPLEQWSENYAGPKFHAVLCDPPYDLSFMGKAWDTGANFKAWGEAILPHLYPGALVLMFGGTRTWHRLACGMEDAGFEIWDTLMWLHGQGFPKAQDISKLIDKANGASGTFGDPKSEAHAGWIKRGKMRGDNNEEGWQRPWMDDPEQVSNAARQYIGADSASQSWSGHKTTALKPAWEPVLCFKKPLIGTYAESALATGSGCLNVDGARIPSGKDHADKCASVVGLDSNRNGNCFGEWAGERADSFSNLGRYPANLILDETSAAMLDEQTGETTSRASGYDWTLSTQGEVPITRNIKSGVHFGDSGGASRFFYCAKSSSSERNAGLNGFEERSCGTMEDDSYKWEGEIARGRQPRDCKRRNIHPTVKPIDLCRYLATLLLPPDSVKPRRLLVPFAGSGSEMIGAMLAGWDEIVGVEQDTEHGYVDIAHARLDWWQWARERSGLTDVTAILTRFGFIETEQTEDQRNQIPLFEELP